MTEIRAKGQGPSARCGHSLAAVGSRVFIFGGHIPEKNAYSNEVRLARLHCVGGTLTDVYRRCRCGFSCLCLTPPPPHLR